MLRPIAKYKFTKLELDTINELIPYCYGKNVESPRVLKGRKNITDKFILEEDELKCNIYAKGEVVPCENYNCALFKAVKKRMLLRDTTFIHFHPRPLPLSAGDILNAFYYRFKKIISVTADGLYSVFVPNFSKAPPINELKAENARIRKIIEEHGGPEYILCNPKNFARHRVESTEFLRRLAKSTGSKYMSNM